MPRSRDIRRAHRERVIRNRLRHIREWSTRSYGWQGPYFWGHDVPGRWSKTDPYTACSCSWCHWRDLWNRVERRYGIDLWDGWRDGPRPSDEQKPLDSAG